MLKAVAVVMAIILAVATYTSENTTLLGTVHEDMGTSGTGTSSGTYTDSPGWYSDTPQNTTLLGTMYQNTGGKWC